MNKTDIINFFAKNTDYKVGDIINACPIKKGFTNTSFLIKTNDDKKFQLRFGSVNEYISRENEYNIIQSLSRNDYIYFDKSSGDMIKVWRNDSIFKTWSNKNLLLFIKEIKKIHNIKIKNDVPIFDPYIMESNFIDNKLLGELKILNSKYKDLKKCVCHNDLNNNNILISKNKLYIIDYEWCKINSPYWDLANMAREKLPYKKILFLIKHYGDLDFIIFKDFLIMTSIYALKWTYTIKQNKKIKKYQKKISKRLNYIRTL